MLVTASREQGVLEEEEQTMLHKVFEFADKDAADVMVPRPDVVALPLELPVAELLRLMLQHPYTRYPVYDGELDDVVGVLHVRDLFAALHDRGIDGVDVRALLRPAIMVPETKRLDELLSDFRPRRTTWRSWSTSTARWPASSRWRTCWRRSWARSATSSTCRRRASGGSGVGRMRLGGSFPIEEFNERFGTSLPDEDYHSVGGFVFGELGRAPKVGDTVTTDGVRFEVSGVDGPRIVEVDVTLKPPEHRSRPPRSGARPQAEAASSSERRAISTSRSVMPPALWLTQSSSTRPQPTSMSG